MTLEEQLNLARLVYPDKEWFEHPFEYPNIEHPQKKVVFKFCWYEPYNLGRPVESGEPVGKLHPFEPSLTGDDWQKAQALDCIVAAMNLGKHCHLHRYDTGPGYEEGCYVSWVADEHHATQYLPDILTAAARALLSQGDV